jgi:WD40 repeat protein
VSKIQLSDELDRSRSFYGAYYSSPETIIVMNKNEKCLAINNQGKETKDISDCCRASYGGPRIYRRLGVKQNKVIVIGKKNKNIKVYNINKEKEELLIQENFLVHSACFALGASRNNYIFTLLEDNNKNGVLKKYNDGHCINKLATDHPQNVNFAAYEDVHKSILCVMEKYINSGRTVLKLYNADCVLQKRYEDHDLAKLAEDDLLNINFDATCQISDDGTLIALIGDGNGYNNKVFIFDITDQYELRLKHSIGCEKNRFCNTLFYPTASIILAISWLQKEFAHEEEKQVIGYYDSNTGDCLYRTLMHNVGSVCSISLRPDGKAVIVTTKGISDFFFPNAGCMIHDVPKKIADKHAHQIGPRIWFCVNEVCEKIQNVYGLIVPKELKQIIAYTMYKA